MVWSRDLVILGIELGDMPKPPQANKKGMFFFAAVQGDGGLHLMAYSAIGLRPQAWPRHCSSTSCSSSSSSPSTKCSSTSNSSSLRGCSRSRPGPAPLPNTCWIRHPVQPICLQTHSGIPSIPLVYRPPCAPTTRYLDHNFCNCLLEHALNCWLVHWPQPELFFVW